MTRFATNSLAAVAAMPIAQTSLSALTPVPLQQGAAIAAPVLA